MPLYLSDTKNELIAAYSVLRNLKILYHLDSNGRYDSVLNVVQIFPRKFILKLLDDRLRELNKVSNTLSSKLFRRLLNESKEPLETNALTISLLPTCRFNEIDEFFHHALYHLHDFVIDLNWHELDLGNLKHSDAEFTQLRLNSVADFFMFQRILDNFFSPINLRTKSVSSIKLTQSTLGSSNTESKMIKSNRSSLASTSEPKSPSRKRQVRFKDLDEEDDGKFLKTEQRLTDDQSILAFDLIIYSLNLFLERLCQLLNEWYKSHASLSEQSAILRETKRRVRTNELSAIYNEIKRTNDVYLTILELLLNVRNHYLIDYTLDTLAGKDFGSNANIYKRRRIQVFIQKVIFEVEKKVLVQLANRCLQLIIDLSLSEINILPVELNIGTKTKNKAEVNRSNENYLSFIMNWLNLDEILPGSSKPKPQSATNPSPINATNSTLASGGLFKSTSRILSQMDNLIELIRDLLKTICDRLDSKRQFKYLLELMHAGYEAAFDQISAKFKNQIIIWRNNDKLGTHDKDSLKDVVKSMDSVAAKIRCLKLIHITSAFDKSIKDAAGDMIDLMDSNLEEKLLKFADDCLKQTQSYQRM